MKFSSIFFAPLILLATSVAAVPTPDADVSSIDAKNALIVSAGDLSAARAAVTGTVNADNVRYRRCANTDCEAIGQYHTGRKITIQCRVRGETIRGWPWWDKMSNGYYISDSYVSWTGGVPDIC